jgi:ketosteroid isomerase-like protein
MLPFVPSPMPPELLATSGQQSKVATNGGEVAMMAPELERVVEQYHQAVDEIVKGNADGSRRAYSRRADVTLANPFGPPVRGREQVEQTLDRAASQMRDGALTGFERIVTGMTAEMAYIVEIERGQTRFGSRDDITPYALRVTTIFRPEEETWKVVHRHADPITTPRPAESLVQP